MPPIRPDLMGDVAPAVQPGVGPEDLGSAVLDGPAQAVVRSHQTLTVTYTCGKFGLDDTGAIRISLRLVTDFGRLQSDDPSGANYVTAVASNGTRLAVLAEPHGYRPWFIGVRVTAVGGYLSPGDTITVVLGDRSGGGPGFLMQTMAEPDFELNVTVDACATGQFYPLGAGLTLPVVAGPPVRWHVVAPGLRRPNEAFSIGIRAEDIWGNPAPAGSMTLRLETDAVIDGLPDEVAVPADQRAVKIEGLSIPSEAVARITLLTENGEELATSNPIVIRDGANAGYWGDLHGQSGETVGIGSIDDYMAYARDLAFLDACAHQGNDFQITNAFWDRINQISAAWNRDGAFVMYPGYEWSGNTPVGGDHNVFFRHEGRQMRRSSHAMLADRSDLSTDAPTLDALFDALKDEDAVVWSHVGGRPADVSYAHDPALKTAVEVHSNWGTFEWILTDSLALGHRVGVVANSDGHKLRPGAGAPGASEFGAYGGLTCFLAPELTRDALFECMRWRHHYGTSGSRMDVDVRARFDRPVKLYARDPRYAAVEPQEVTEAIMGDLVETGDAEVTLSVQIHAGPIERVDVLDGPDLIHTERTYDVDNLGNRVRVYWQGAEYRGRGRNTSWRGDIKTGAQITAMSRVNHFNLDKPIDQVAPNHISFQAVTSGNFGGVDLRLDGPGQIDVQTNLVSGSVPLEDLGLEDHVLDAGGLERRIVIRRLPDELDQGDLQFQIPINVAEGRDTPIWVRVTTLDGHQAWSSPIYLWR
ncbi:MAG: DUF3604 domain-containing protein [Pseudomonadota bacterium]